MPRLQISNVMTFPDLHEVVGHGRARRSSSARSSQVEVEVVATPLSSGYRFPHGLEKVLWVGCGELGSLPVGSRWRNGLPEQARPLRSDGGGKGAIKSVRTIVFGDWPPTKDAVFFPTGRLAGTPCFLITLTGDSHRLVMLPVTEAIRSMFGRTSDLLLQLYGGRVAEEIGRFQIAPDLVQENADGRVHLRFPRRPTKLLAMLCAMVLTDPELAESFYRVNRDLTQAQGWKDGDGVVVHTTCPFKQGSEIEYEGRWIGRANDDKIEKRFLITRILSASVKPVFHTLVVSFPWSKVDPEAPPNDARIEIGGIDKIYVKSDRDPARGGAEHEIVVPGSDLHLESGVDFLLDPDTPAMVRPPPDFRGDDGGKRQGSAGDAVPGGDRRTKRVKTRDASKLTGPDPRDVSRKATDAAVARMSAERRWPRRHPHGTPCVDVGRGLEVLIVGFQVGDVEVMVCDAGTAEYDPRSVGLVAKSNRGTFDGKDLAVLRGFLDDGGAHFLQQKEMAAACGFMIRGVFRPPAETDIAIYGAQLAAAIDRFLDKKFSS